MSAAEVPCPVCRGPRAREMCTVDQRRYLCCPACECRFLDPVHRLDLDAERRHYALHDNRVDDPGYRRFLGRLVAPLLERLPAGSEGLDFGCGPGPALAAMLTEAGHRVRLYDPAFAPDAGALDAAYDFVTCTEVIEHLHDPAAVFDQLAGLLRPGGWLGLMTCFQTDDARFAGWHYRRDPTHVVFYREQTLRHLADSLGLSLEIPCKDVALLQRPERLTPPAGPR